MGRKSAAAAAILISLTLPTFLRVSCHQIAVTSSAWHVASQRSLRLGERCNSETSHCTLRSTFSVCEKPVIVLQGQQRQYNHA